MVHPTRFIIKKSTYFLTYKLVPFRIPVFYRLPNTEHPEIWNYSVMLPICTVVTAVKPVSKY
jgi:hypothetical protein